MTRTTLSCMLATAALAISPIGCGESGSPAADAGANAPAWVLASAPADAKSVTETKADAAEGDTVILRGRIGGRMEPISHDSPAFTVMDLAIPHCGQIPGDSCGTPWDYCCETPESITANAATIQVVGDDGAPITGSPADHGFAALDEVIIVGTVGPRPNNDILTVRATGLYRVE